MKRITLESIYEFNNQLPTAILDCRVLLFDILSAYSSHAERLKFDSVLRKDWLLAKWALIINNPVPWLRAKPKAGWNVLVVDDCKNEQGVYWRNEIVLSKGLPRYKGNRNYDDRPDTYYEILDVLKGYLSAATCPVAMFSQLGFEADDFAGLAARIKPISTGPLFLVTVDTDWSQLVCDNKQILFASTRNFEPRLRSEYEVLLWAKRKGWLLSHPKQIASIKVKFGDASDNLLPGSPKGVIDLLEPTIMPDSEHEKTMLKCLMAELANTNSAHSEAAYSWLLKHNLLFDN